jgi:hypothetical protein
MDQDALEALIKKDDIETLRHHDMFFTDTWTERATEHKAYKCLDYLLNEKNVPFSKYCFLRAIENGDNLFFTTYLRYLKDISAKFLYSLLLTSYERDNYNLFVYLFVYIVETYRNTPRWSVLRKIGKHILGEPFVDVGKHDYVRFIASVKDVFHSRDLLSRPELLEGQYIGRKTFGLVLRSNLELPLTCRFPRSFCLTRTMKSKHRDTIRYYSGVVEFRTKK